MWGDRVARSRIAVHARFIPTHVGRSLRLDISITQFPVHPHACGEICCQRQPQLWNAGSSPRMWGDHETGRPTYRKGRFIPTHVGRSRLRRQRLPINPVHPHACGEIPHETYTVIAPIGSSPRMWGDLFDIEFQRVFFRFIPTHVGRSDPCRSTLECIPVHPHACGEICSRPTPARRRGGSSPRMWGDLDQSRFSF
ncbi:MAG: hypothetical protein JWQ98_559 [Chlorobi bacterium]|nr:hypothetical protein [Chlorobiota bacterium]